MATHSQAPTLAAGAFFGHYCHSVTTPTFHFSELQATVPERKVPRHTHQAPHFILVTQGLYVTEARNQSGICAPGTFIFNPAGTTHRDCFRSKRGKFLSITVADCALRLLDRASPVSTIVSGSGMQLPHYSLIGARIANELRLRLQSSSLVLEGLGFELMGCLSGAEERTASSATPPWLAQAKEMVEDCACTDLSVGDLAQAAGVHRVYLARAYRRYFGYSPGEHVRYCRLLRVQELLSTRLPLAQVALQCGFSDQSQMTRSFSTYFGLPPARYRRMLGK